VIVAMRTDEYLHNGAFGVEDGGGSTHSEPVKATLWSAALHHELSVLTRAGLHVVLVHPVPRLRVDASGCAGILVATGRCGGPESRVAVDHDLAVTSTAEEHETHGLPLVTLLNLEPELCDESACPLDRRGIQLYSDEMHLSVPGSRTLTSTFRRTIVANVRSPRS
jgi:hypothetical protein